MKKISNLHVINYIGDAMCKDTYVSNDVKKLFKYLEHVEATENNYFDNELIEECIKFAERYFFKLMPWQKFIISYIFYFQKDGLLRFNEFFLLMGRGGGKNGFLSIIASFLISDKYPIKKYDVSVVATSEQQALCSFNEVKDMLDDNQQKLKRAIKDGTKRPPDLSKVYAWNKTEIRSRKNLSTFSYATSNARTKDGGRQGAIFADEVHEFVSWAIIDVLRSGLGKVKHPRTFYTTTNGNVRGGVLDKMIEDSEELLKTMSPNNKMFPFICRLDNFEEVDKFELWEKANPSIKYFPTLRETMETEYHAMTSSPDKKFNFMTKRMNLPIQNELNDVTSWDNVLATNQPFLDFEGKTAIGGIDYASFRDICAVGLLFKEGDKYYFMSHAFITVHAIQQVKFNAPLDLWASQGHLTITNELPISKETLVGWFDKQRSKYNIDVVACDTYRATAFKEEFESSGYEIGFIRSGYVTHNKLAPQIENLFDEHKIILGDNPFMRWCIGNVYVDRDAKGNKSYKKKEETRRKTDGFMAFLHALAFEDRLPEEFELVNYEEFEW